MPMLALRLQALHYRLSFLRPFGVAHGTRNHTDVVYVRASFNGHTGYGEAAVPPYLGYDTPELVQAFHTWFPSELNDSLAIRQVLASLTQVGHEIPKPIRCAVDLAMHDLLGKISGLPVRAVFGIPEAVRECAFTIGIGSVEDVIDQVQAHPQITLFKMKLGGPIDRDRVEALLKTGHTRFCVDANQAWKSVEDAVDEIRWLAERGCLFVEQPMPVSMDHELPRLKSLSPLPIILDESLQDSADLERLAASCHGINVKLLKCAGLAPAVNLIRRANRLGLKVLVGCMSDSACGASAAAQLAGWADWLDLDGPLLIGNDPFRKPEYRDGKLWPDTSPGTGACLIQAGLFSDDGR